MFGLFQLLEAPTSLGLWPLPFPQPSLFSLLTSHESGTNFSPASASPFKDRGGYIVHYSWTIKDNTSILRLAERKAILILSATLIPLCGHYSAYHNLQDAFRTLGFRSKFKITQTNQLFLTHQRSVGQGQHYTE